MATLKIDEPNMVYFQTNFEKYPFPRARQHPGGAAAGVFFQNVFENTQYLAHPTLKVAIWLVKKIRFVGDENYQNQMAAAAASKLRC